MDRDDTGPRRPGRSAGWIAAAAALTLLAAPPVLAEDGAAPATLTVRGSAAVDQAPDLATLGVVVVTREPTLAGVVRDHAGRVAAAKALLARLAAAGVTVEEGSFGLGPENDALVSTFRAATRFDLTLHALEKLDATVSEIAGSGLFEVESAQFGTADSAGATDRARRAAMADARHQAEVYAEAGGLRLDGIQHVDAAQGGLGSAGFHVQSAVRSSSVGVQPPKALTVTADVTVTWRVAPR